MSWTKWQWVALIWIAAVFAGAFILLFGEAGYFSEFWFKLVAPFVTASLLGMWLVAGIGPVWLRLLGMVVGQSALILVMAMVVPENPVGFAPGLAATTASTALTMLGLGCLGSVFPIQSTWSIRFALWEIVISVGLIGMAMAVIRVVSEQRDWDWPEWASHAGIHYLLFSLFTGLLMTIVLLPLVVRGRSRLFAILLLLLAFTFIPPIELWTFRQLVMFMPGVDLFYAAHTGQTVMALAIMVPLVIFFPGVLVRQNVPQGKPVDPAGEKENSPGNEQDFEEMQ